MSCNEKIKKRVRS